MPRIELETLIQAKPQILFDLSRSVDLHQHAAAHTQEEAIAGRTEGLMELHEVVTWRAKHFGIYQKLTVRITEYEFPTYFADEMISGAFKGFKHEHHFEDVNGHTRMRDVFDYQSPLGILGKLADYLFLKRYMTQFLNTRNQHIKEFAESGKWKALLK